MKAAPNRIVLAVALAGLINLGSPGGLMPRARAQAAITSRSVPVGASGTHAPPPSHPQPVSGARRATVAIHLYRALAHGSGNVFVSPYSLEMVLAMAQAGARGNTAKTFAEVLGSDPAGSPAQPGGEGLTYTVANALWAQRGFALRPGYVTEIRRKFDGLTQSLDFRGAPRAAAKTINDWVSAKTHGRIGTLVSPRALEHGTSLILTDAVYFKGGWVKPFDSGDTYKQNFHLPHGRRVRTEMMHNTAHFAFYRGKGFKLLMLPFRGGRDTVDMLVLLPHHINQLGSLERHLNVSTLDDWISEANESLVEVTLPKFRDTQSLDLSRAARALGLAVAFSPRRADFSGIATPASRRLYVSDILQKTFVDLNEKGTEAAAATEMRMTVATARYESSPEQPVTFNANHRFIYLIQDETTGDILFIGRMSNPESQVAKSENAIGGY
jgi:serpin B